MRGKEWVLQIECYLGILPLMSGRLFSSLKICNLRLEPLIMYILCKWNSRFLSQQRSAGNCCRAQGGCIHSSPNLIHDNMKAEEKPRVLPTPAHQPLVVEIYSRGSCKSG